eukprot:CAMPEP_0196738800 /NCGR_PEP_ID=MMETSP1091-20130531/16988_1 /TAXON_ID=302021 /ORGANISM="Rhodomonas sp., Strain CCMP768" /LENGTH=35 /DNA_ID= /DNA_START= /DNA_END= /DNA_ORIENTATION=
MSGPEVWNGVTLASHGPMDLAKGGTCEDSAMSIGE